MKRQPLKLARLGAILLSSTCLAGPAFAQSLPAVRATLDENGVDLATGTYNLAAVSISVGGSNGLSWTQGRADILTAGIHKATNPTTGQVELEVVVGAMRNTFIQSGSTFTAKEGDGSTLSLSGTVYTYRGSGGDVALFQKVNLSTTVPIGNGNEAYITTLALPSGKVITYVYRVQTMAVGQSPGGTIYRDFMRLQSVSDNLNHRLHATYQLDTMSNLGQLSQWQNRQRLMALDTSVDACSATVNSCTTTVTWPKIDFGSSGDLTDALGRVTTTTSTATSATLRFPGSTSDDITVTITSGKVSAVAQSGVTTTYSYADSGGIRTTTVTRGSLPSHVRTFDLTTLQMLTDTDELGHTTTYTYNSSAQLTRITHPEGNYTAFTRDSRGNVTETRLVAKTAGTPADIVTTASFDTTCSNPVKCNSPNSVTDARGNVTDYTYDATHGGILTETAPAATGGANRAQMRYSYTQLGANGSASASGAWMLTGTSTCATGVAPACVGTADELKTTITYGQGLEVASVTTAAGDGSLTSTTSASYDAVGNLVAVDGPASGSGDTSYARFDAIRRPLGKVGPDPDGGGSLKARATRISYNSDGTVASIETGTDTTPSSSGFGGFTALQRIDSTYDSNKRLAKQTVSAGSTTYQLSQYSYDAVGRVECVAVRMNSATWSSLPSSACSLGTTGSFGPDRITKKTYDATSRVTKVTSAYATGDAADDSTLTFTNNGQVATATDAEGNKTSYSYDGHDRPWKIFFPDATKGAGTSSTTDYQQLSYDASSNVTSRRLRDGTSIGYTFDNRDYLTAKDLPGSEPDVTYTYNLLGQKTGASQSGNALTFAFDILGRNTGQTGPLGTVSYQYDVSGRRTRMTWPDGLYVSYDHLVTGEVTVIRENGATTGAGVLATYAYDDLGRRTSLTRGNGTVTSYGFDDISRLTSLAQDLGPTTSTTNDVTNSFGYSPAGQIVSHVRSNDVYAWDGHSNLARAYTSNGLNQISVSGNRTLSHDARGNLWKDALTGTPTNGTEYLYDSQNELTGVRTTATTPVTIATLAYDPMLRLYQTVGSTTTRFQYDGQDMIGEYDGSNTLQRRFVHGPGADEPLLWYEGSGTSDRRWLHADERGSVVAVTGSTGAVLSGGINSYDEYGIPASTNLGRFQYTGQAWIPEIGMSYYKARMYSPTLGRFLQTDPIGYADGMNDYNYTGSDPVNATDPSGLQTYYIPVVNCVQIYIPYAGTNPTDPNEIVVNGGQLVLQCTNSVGIGGTPGPGVGPTPGGPTPGGGGGGAGAPAAPAAPDGRCHRSPILRILGKLWALPNTLLGLVWGAVNFAGGLILGTHPQIRFGNDAIQFLNGPLQINHRAITLGNVQIYGTPVNGQSVGPESSTQTYDGKSIVNTGDHEEGHSFQSEVLGPFYLPFAIGGGLAKGSNNPLEKDADNHAKGGGC